MSVVSSGDKGIPYTQDHQNSKMAIAFRDAIKPIILYTNGEKNK